MTRKHAEAIFLLAGIDALRSLEQIANNYWPDTPKYYEDRRSSPWWLVATRYGLIRIGWRKRVISIEWDGTSIRRVVTVDDVTKNETMVHAWSYAKAVEYLTAFQACGLETVFNEGKKAYQDGIPHFYNPYHSESNSYHSTVRAWSDGWGFAQQEKTLKGKDYTNKE